jgi:hypothetical protein
LRSISAGSGFGGPCSSGSGSGAGSTGFGSGAGAGAAGRFFSVRSSTTVAAMASVVGGGGRCFQLNQPYTAAATMAVCSSTDSTTARHRPFGCNRSRRDITCGAVPAAA